MLRYWLVAMLALGLVACAPAPMIDKRPWPKNADGTYAEGVALVVVLFDYNGDATEACVEKSSGNAEIDAVALRRATRVTHTPAMIEGWPVSGYARVPVAVMLSKDHPHSQVPLPGTLLRAGCRTQPVEFARKPSQVRKLTIRQVESGKMPVTGTAWPVDREEGPEHGEYVLSALVTPDGALVKYRLGSPRLKVFDGDIKAQISKLSFAPTDKQHWELVRVALEPLVTGDGSTGAAR